MNEIETIKKIAQKSLEDTENLKLYNDNREYVKFFHYLKRLFSSSNPLDILTIPNYYLFLLAVVAPEQNKSLFPQYKEELADLETIVNNWQFNLQGKDLLELYDHTTNEGNLEDFKYTVNFSNLGLSLLSINYNLKLAYIVMYKFLELKEELKKAHNGLIDDKLLSNLPNGGSSIIKRKHQDYLKRICEQSYVNTFLDALEKELKKETKDFKITQDNIEKRKKYTLEVINHKNLSSITCIPDNWHRYLDPELLEELYNLIQINLVKQCRELEQKEQELNSMRNRSKLTSFLYSKGYNPYSIDKELLAKLENNEDIIFSIEELMKYGLSINEIFTNYIPILLTLSRKQINTVRELLEKHALFPETLKNKIEIIFGSKYLEILTNVSILEPIIEFDNIFYNDQILFESPDKIRGILKILSTYDLTKNNFIYLLCHFEYMNIYDLLLEHNISIELFISICKTSEPLNTVKRIILYKKLSEPYETNNHRLKREIVSEERFICSNEELDTAVPNIIPLVADLSRTTGATLTFEPKHPIIEELDEVYRIDNLYLIGNATISRSKFIKYFSSSKRNSSSIIPSLVTDSILEQSEYYSLCGEINNFVLRKAR